MFEPLDTLLMAYESWLKSREALDIQWEKYPDHELERRRFTICKWLIEVTQNLEEQKQNQNKDKIKMQQDSQSPNQNKVPPLKRKDEQSSPLELQIGQTKENLLK